MDIQRTLDRLVEFDERSKNFRAVEGIEEKPLRSYTWRCDVYNDQGREGACVGYAWGHELSARPKVYPVDGRFSSKIYHRAQRLDQWPGTDYEGTSVLAGIKAVMEILNEHGDPLYGGYRWAFGLEDTVRTIGYRGPVVLGVNWYRSMYYPDANGFVRPQGEVMGGHAILANGVRVVPRSGSRYPCGISDADLDKSYVRLHNSWGRDYGLGGDALITLRDLRTLLKNDGEACVPTIRRR